MLLLKSVVFSCVFYCKLCWQNALAEELELTTDGSDIFISRKLEPFVICAISLTSASVKTEGKHRVKSTLSIN